jgi:hypothetical protein
MSLAAEQVIATFAAPSLFRVAPQRWLLSVKPGPTPDGSCFRNWATQNIAPGRKPMARFPAL